jgi:hypothetical protein
LRNAVADFEINERNTSFMKTLVSVVLGAAVLFGAATLGLQSGSASARERHDKNYWKHHRRHHHRHYRHNKLSY